MTYLGIAADVRGGAPGGYAGVAPWASLAAVGAGLGLSVSPLLTQALAHVPPGRAADAAGLLTTMVQLGQLLGVAARAFLSRAFLARTAIHPAAAGLAQARVPASARLPASAHALASGGAMSSTACGLAVLSVAALSAAVLTARAAYRQGT